MKPGLDAGARQKKEKHTMQLFRRLPKLRWLPGPDRPFISPEEQSTYPELARDLQVLDEELMPKFYALDKKALKSQNQFWLEQLILLIGSALAAILGAIQIAFINSAIPGLVETVVTILLAAITYRVRVLNAQKLYFTNRLAAETLRGEYYLFLGRIGDYANDQNRRQNLIKRVARIVRQSGGVAR